MKRRCLLEHVDQDIGHSVLNSICGEKLPKAEGTCRTTDSGGGGQKDSQTENTLCVCVCVASGLYGGLSQRKCVTHLRLSSCSRRKSRDDICPTFTCF